MHRMQGCLSSFITSDEVMPRPSVMISQHTPVVARWWSREACWVVFISVLAINKTSRDRTCGYATHVTSWKINKCRTGGQTKGNVISTSVNPAIKMTLPHNKSLIHSLITRANPWRFKPVLAETIQVSHQHRATQRRHGRRTDTWAPQETARRQVLDVN
jgi:hypothetical protein